MVWHLCRKKITLKAAARQQCCGLLVWRTLLRPKQDTVLASGSMDCTTTLWQTDSVYKCPRILEGHEEGIQVLAFHSDGQILASGSRDATIRLRDVLEGTCTTTLEGRHGGCIRSLAFCSDDKTLVSSSEDRYVCLWNVSDSSSTILERRPKCVRNLLLSDNGRCLACESEFCDILLREVSQNKCTLELKGHGQPDRYTSVASHQIANAWHLESGICIYVFGTLITGAALPLSKATKPTFRFWRSLQMEKR